MPGTLVNSLGGSFRQDHNNIPMIHISYDGQEDTNIDMRLQAFMHQAHRFRDKQISSSKQQIPFVKY